MVEVPDSPVRASRISRLTYENDPPSTRTTCDVLEDGERKHAFDREEYGLFMPQAPTFKVEGSFLAGKGATAVRRCDGSIRAVRSLSGRYKATLSAPLQRPGLQILVDVVRSSALVAWNSGGP